MANMPRPRPPHLQHERTRHGELVWYVRVDKGPRIRIEDTYGTPEFDAAYHATVAGEALPESAPKVSTGTFSWLLDRYRDSQAWSKLSAATRKQREAIFRPVGGEIGAKPFGVVTRRSMQASLDRRRDTPFQDRDFLDATRGLFRWAVGAQHVEADPTEGIRAAKLKTEGFKVWTVDEVALFERKWPIGTRERMAFDLLLYTGLRRGDVAQLGRQHVKNCIITLRTAKTGQVVNLPVLPQLAESIAATRTGDLASIATAAGSPMVKEEFGNRFRNSCIAAGVKDSGHELRKLGATHAADNGATEVQLEAIVAWRGGGMASLYTRAANRKKLAIEAMDKMAPREQTEKSYFRTSPDGAGAKAKK